MKNAVTTMRAWVKASRLPSQSYIFFPLALGFAIADKAPFALSLFLFVALYGVALQLYIVYANDVADYALDTTNTTHTIFSGGSRVLVTGMLSKRALTIAAAGAGAVVLAVSLFLALTFARPAAPLFACASLIFLWAYSFPPVRLSYRGGGELLQMAGTAFILPLFAYYVRMGSLTHFPYTLFTALPLLHLACAMATALPDEPSDRAGGKRTLAVILGARATKTAIILLNAAGLVVAFFVLFRSAPVIVRGVTVGVPFIAVAATPFFFPASPPGSRRLSVFVFLALFPTIIFTALYAAFFFFR